MKFSKHLIAAAILAAGLTQAALAQTYQAGTSNLPIKIVSLLDLEKQAQQSM